MGKCGENKPGELCDICKNCEKGRYSYLEHGCDSGCVYCPNSGCYHHFVPPQQQKPKKTIHTIRFISTPNKCKDCFPTAEKVKRRSCRGCVKYAQMLKDRRKYE